jgi:hypothetical protein
MANLARNRRFAIANNAVGRMKKKREKKNRFVFSWVSNSTSVQVLDSSISLNQRERKKEENKERKPFLPPITKLK